MIKSDVELIQSVLEGDKNAFPELVERHLDALHRFVFRYVRSSDDADDVTQEAFIRAWKNLKKFDQTKNFKTWLFTIAKNASLDLLKKKKPILFGSMSEEDGALDAVLAPYLDDPAAPDVLFERAVVKEDMTKALGTLPPAYRTVLTMRYNENLKFREIAEVLGEPIDTVKSKHRRGLALLKKTLA